MKQAIRRAFDGDFEVIDYYDPTVSVETMDDVVDDIYRKLYEYSVLFEFYFSDRGDAYFVKSRNSERLQRFWDDIVEQLGGKFQCALWTKNTRAINWLKKMGMVETGTVEYKENSITILCL